MTGGYRQRVIAPLMALLVILGACGSETASEAAQPTPTAADSSTTATPEPADAQPEPEPSGTSLVDVSQAFIAHLEAGEYQEMVALMSAAYRDESFLTRTAAQFWTFTSRFSMTPDVATVCDAVGTQVECSWRGTDDVASVLGYQKRSEFLFTFDEGAVDDIIYFANDSEILQGLTTWVDQNHPGELACAAAADDVDAHYGGPGELVAVDGEVFGASCADRLVANAAEYRDSGLYLPPLGE